MPDTKKSQREPSHILARTALRDHEEYEDRTLALDISDQRNIWERASELVLVLHANRMSVLRGVALGTIMSIGVAFLLPKRYEATARLMPPDSQMNPLVTMLLGGMADKLSGVAGSGLLGMKSTGGMFVGVLESRTVEDKLINDFDLKNVYRDKYWEDARKDLEANTEITEDKKSGIIAVKVRDKDPDRASRMAAAYVDELNRLLAQVSTSSARRERIFIEGRLKDVTADLNAAAEKFSRFASENRTLDIKEQTVVMVGAAADLQGQLIAAESELQGLSQIYGPEHVRVRAVTAKIAALRRELQKMAGSSDPNKTQQEDGPYPSIRKLPLLGVEWANLYRDTKVQEKVLDLLTQQYEMSKIQEVKETPTVKILDQPVTPQKKVWPPRGIITLAGMFFSALVSMGWVVLRKSWTGMPESAPPKQFVNTVFEALRTKKASSAESKVAGA